MSKLFLIRHGETKLNSAERYWGKTDVELSEYGIWQAERLRERLTEVNIDFIYASGLKRAQLTARTIASRHQVEIITDDNLREVDFGKFEGLNFREIAQQYPELAGMWADWSTEMKFPGGESVTGLNDRVCRFLPMLDNHLPQETVAVVAHSAPLRLLVCHLLGIAPRHWRQFHLDLGSLTIIDTYPQGAIIERLNDTSHLK